MAGLWKLPIIYLCENNLYGMGTPQEKAAHNTQFYTRGGKIPGFKFDAQNVIMVREAIKWAGNYVKEHGPLYLEADTYRYHGHSMSDPGVSYRTKEEIQIIREGRDPVEIARKMLVEFGWANEADLKKIEKTARAKLDAEAEMVKKDPFPTYDDLFTDIGNTPQHYIRNVEYKDSIHIDPKHLQ